MSTSLDHGPTHSLIKRVVLAGFCASVLVLVRPSLAEACSCGGVAPSSGAFNHAAAVFVGTAVEVTGGMPQPVVAAFSVTKTYRGAVEQHVVLSGNGTNCDIAFVKGVAYLVYAGEHGRSLQTHKCTRTRPLSGAGEDVRYLDNLTTGRPQALVYGEVLRRITQPDGSMARQALFEPLEVVAKSSFVRRSVTTDQWGPFQVVLTPGDYAIWVERRGQRVTAPEQLSLGTGGERRISFTAEYP